MKQSRAASLVESVGSTLTGFLLALVLQATVLPAMLGAPVPLSVNVAFTLVMTVASIARQYAWRRLMEALNLRQPPLSPFMRAVVAERRRQVEVDGFTPEHDDGLVLGELAQAGACYALTPDARDPPSMWPWRKDWWRTLGMRRDLVKGAALIAAEGERFDRTRTKRDGAPSGMLLTPPLREGRVHKGGRNFGITIDKRPDQPPPIQARRPGA